MDMTWPTKGMHIEFLIRTPMSAGVKSLNNWKTFLLIEGWKPLRQSNCGIVRQLAEAGRKNVVQP